MLWLLSRTAIMGVPHTLVRLEQLVRLRDALTPRQQVSGDISHTADVCACLVLRNIARGCLQNARVLSTASTVSEG